jgi:hypothetical protein
VSRLIFRWSGWLLWVVVAVVLGELSCGIVRAEPLGPIEWMNNGGTTVAPSESAPMSFGLPGSVNPAPNCRYGTSTLTSAQVDWLAPLGAGWYLDFSAHAPTSIPGVEFAQSLYVRQLKNGCTYLNGYSVSPSLADSDLGALIAVQPGALWIVGNEPDRGPDPANCLGAAQGDTYPDIYAQAYHDVYQFIKSRDATARVAIAGLVEVTPGRLQYLDKVWQAYQQRYQSTMPVDVWNMHLYILPEAEANGTPNGVANVALGTDPALAIRDSSNNPNQCAAPGVYCWAEHDDLSVFAQQVVAMRTWMQQHGERDKPLILSEYSQLYPFTNYDDPINPTVCYLQDEYGKCFTQARVTSFLNRTFDYLESAIDANLGYPLDGNRLVQQWLWYTVYTSRVGYVSSLVTSDLQVLTQPGVAYSSIVASHPTYVNLVPRRVAAAASLMPTPAHPVTATLQVDVINSGNTQITTPFTVTAYADQALTQPIGSATVMQGISGCFQRTARVSVAWPNLSLGTHFFWIKVDSTGAVNESAEDDNVIMGKFTIYPHGVLLPLVNRD